MTAHSLPPRPSLIQLKKQAKELLHAHQAGNPDVCDTMRCLKRFSSATDGEILSAQLKLADVQHALPKSYGFRGWAELKSRVRELEEQATVSSEDTAHDGTPTDFAPRVALRSLRELQQADVPATGEPSEYRERLLGLLAESLHSLG